MNQFFVNNASRKVSGCILQCQLCSPVKKNPTSPSKTRHAMTATHRLSSLSFPNCLVSPSLLKTNPTLPSRKELKHLSCLRPFITTRVSDLIPPHYDPFIFQPNSNVEAVNEPAKSANARTNSRQSASYGAIARDASSFIKAKSRRDVLENSKSFLDKQNDQKQNTVSTCLVENMKK